MAQRLTTNGEAMLRAISDGEWHPMTGAAQVVVAYKLQREGFVTTVGDHLGNRVKILVAGKRALTWLDQNRNPVSVEGE